MDDGRRPPIRISAGTPMSQHGNRVTIDFMAEAEADAFIEWIMWLTQQTEPVTFESTPLKPQ